MSPLSGCGSDAAWQERQFIAGLCHPGLGGADAWPGVDLWQVRQEGVVESGTWQLTQWR